MILGVEIGGTKLQIVRQARGIHPRVWRQTVAPSAGAQGILLALEVGLAEQLDGQSCVAVGVGFGGPVARATGRVLTSHQVGGWADFPLAEWFTARLNAPCVVGNDADVAGLGEARLGAGRGYNPLFYVTAGSGVGGGFILNDHIQVGAGRGAGEIGHLTVTVRGESGTVESFASGWAIARRANAESGEVAVERALAQDDRATQAFADAVEALAQSLATVIAIICPARIVLGGGVSLMPQSLMLNPLRTRLAELTFPPFQGLTDLVPAALGELTVPLGAIELARQQFPTTAGA